MIKIYSYQLQDVYCCDCFFDRVAAKLFSSRETTACDEFINTLEEKFPDDKFVVRVFCCSALLVCNSMFKFIVDNKKKSDPLMRKSCVPDLFVFEEIRACIVCLIEIVQKNDVLKKFKLKRRLRNEFLYM